VDLLNSGPSPWNCPTCEAQVTSRYCPVCGERPLDPRDLTLRGLAGQFFGFLVSLDHRIIYSVRCMLTRPGQLTVDFERGRRQVSIGPFKLFVLANLLFFAVQSTTELRVFSTPLQRQLQGDEGSDFGRAVVRNYLEKNGLTAEAYAPIYDQEVAVHARSMIGLMVLPFAMFLPVVFWRAARPFAVHIVFSVHFFSFLLLLYCVPAAAIGIRAVMGGPAALTQSADNVVSILLLIALAGYLYFAIRRVYDARGIPRIVQTLLLATVYFGCFLSYRFALVPITVLMT
jgi:Protein of unknown function (DUF3667)